MENSAETTIKCECGYYLTVFKRVSCDGNTYRKLVCKNCGTVYVETRPGRNVWEKME